ncbi:MAG: two-component regulator propeller domain-containing protein [Bacteroides sp.]
MKKHRYLWTLLCILVSQTVYAEFFKHIGAADGLSQSSVMAIYQDQLGRMWFGTREGINMYDGRQMTVYKGEAPSYAHPSYPLLIGNEVSGITGNKEGDLFFIVNGALLRYDIRKESFEELRAEGVMAINSFQGEVYLATNDSIFRYLALQKKIEFRAKTYLKDVNYILPDKGAFYIGAKQGIYCLTNDRPPQCLLAGVDVYRIFKSSKQEFWIGSRTQGLYRMNKHGVISQVPYKQLSGKGISSVQIREFVEDKKGNIWFGTFDGLQRYNAQTDSYSLIRTGSRPGSLNHSSIFSLYQDMQGTIWVGSYYGGVNYFNPDNNIFSYYAYNPDRSDCLNYPFAGAMVEDKEQNLWVCTDGGGLSCLDHISGRFRTYTAGRGSLPHNNLKSICYDAKRDYLYIGTHMGGLSRYDRRRGLFHNYLYDSPANGPAPNDVIFQVYFCNDRLYVSARNGLFVMDPDTDQFQLLYSGEYYLSFDVDAEGGIWLATGMTLIHFYPGQAAKEEKINLQDFGCRFWITKVLVGHDGQVYIATLGSGLFCYNPRTKSLVSYTSEKSQLLSNYCYNLVETLQRHLLITGNRGATLFNPIQKTFRSIELGSGLSLSSIINGCGVCAHSNGEIFIGGTSGLTSFREEDLNMKYPQPKLYFTNLYVNNTRITPSDPSEVLTEALPFTKEVSLKASQNNLTLEFATSNYIDILNNTWYEYKLEGFDREWLLTTENSLKYTNLDPGTYTLLVREKGNSLNARETQEISLHIRISPPWYLTWWACLLFLSSAVFVGFWLYRVRYVRRTLALSLEKERVEKLHIEKMNQDKLRFFTNVSHEFRTPLTLIISQIELLLQNATMSPAVYNQVLKISKHARQMRDLISELLDFRKFDQHHIQLKIREQDLNSFVQESYLSFLEYASGREIDYQLASSVEDVSIWIDPWQMKKVLFNILSNAFKHTDNKGSIRVTVTESEESVCIAVKDSGKGISQKDQKLIFDRFYQVEEAQTDAMGSRGTGIGLALTRSIIEMHHGSIEVESTLNQGSCFFVKLPKGRTIFEQDAEISFDENREEPTLQAGTLPDDVFISECFTEESDARGEGSLEKRTVLLVEDNLELLEILKQIFTPLYRVLTAANGEEGLMITINEKPDLVVSDVMMPVMTGTEMCMQMKENILICHIPVVLLTALDTLEQNLDGLKRGADDYITKPFNARMLLARCNNLIRNRLLAQSRFAKETTTSIDMLVANPLDKAFLDKVSKVVNEHIDNVDFDIAILCKELGVGRTLLHTKFKALTGMTPNEFVLNHRLKQAAQLLHSESYLHISEIADRLGFGSPRYFTRCFKNQYGMSPLEFRKNETHPE